MPHRSPPSRSASGLTSARADAERRWVRLKKGRTCHSAGGVTMATSVWTDTAVTQPLAEAVLRQPVIDLYIYINIYIYCPGHCSCCCHVCPHERAALEMHETTATAPGAICQSLLRSWAQLIIYASLFSRPYRRDLIGPSMG